MAEAFRITRQGGVERAAWDAVAAADAELRAEPDGRWSWAGPEWLAEAARWGWTEQRYEGFRWQDGAVLLHAPEPCVLRKAWLLAESLGAEVLDSAGDRTWQDGRTHLARALAGLTAVENAETLKLLLAQPWVASLQHDKRWQLPLAECIVKLRARERATRRTPWFLRLFRGGPPPRR